MQIIMEDKKRILIVEDDADISMVEEAYLEAVGFETRIVTDGTGVSSLIRKEKYDLILLDLMLPGKSGYEICREIRDVVDIPILMVTARTESVDKIRGLGLGADDYISKPFDPAELVARVNANLRQYERMLQKFPQEKSKEQLFEKIWGYDFVGDSATVMVHINRIREKNEDDSKNPKILETVWGAGYRLNK